VSAAFPSLDWFRVAENWQGFCLRVNLRLVNRLAAKPGAAVNAEIDSEAAELRQQGVPSEIVQAFIQQYRDQRAMLLKSAALIAKEMEKAH
jgi:hypothetical protein